MTPNEGGHARRTWVGFAEGLVVGAVSGFLGVLLAQVVWFIFTLTQTLAQEAALRLTALLGIVSC